MSTKRFPELHLFGMQAQPPAEASQQGQDEKPVQTQEAAGGHVEFDPDSVLEDKMFESGD